MTTVIRNTPAELIPQELFIEEKIQEYWNVICSDSHHEHIGIDHLENSFLLYPKPQNVDTIHGISLMYKNIRDKFPNQSDAICIDVYDNDFNLLVLKNMNIVFTGYFHFTAKEDIVYHLANVSQHFFDDISKIMFCYEQISPKILRFLKTYFEMKPL